MSTLQVTPGCPFMSRLEQYLNYYAVRYLQQRRSQGISPDLKFVIDHSNNPGEGEVWKKSPPDDDVCELPKHCTDRDFFHF